MDTKIALFYLSFNHNSLTNEDIFQHIKSLINQEIKRKVFNLIFNTKPIKIKFEHRINYPHHAAEQIEIRRKGQSMRSERLRRTNERREEMRNERRGVIRNLIRNERINEINERRDEIREMFEIEQVGGEGEENNTKKTGRMKKNLLHVLKRLKLIQTNHLNLITV